MKTPLAWLNLLHDRVRTVVAVAGVAFAVVLILMQLGFLNSVKQTATQIYGRLEFDLLLISPQYLHISKPGVLPKSRLYQAKSVPGVADARPLYLGFNVWLNERERRRRGIFVMGFDLANPVFRLPELSGDAASLRMVGNVLMDRHSRSEFGAWDVGDVREVAQRRVKIAGAFTMGTGFGADGAIIVGDRTFRYLFPGHRPDDVSLGLVRLEAGADPDETARRLKTALPDDVDVLTRAQIEQRERDHWVNKTSVGIIFTLGVVVGFIVGTAIVYQVLSSDIANHMSEYATLKAMGYGAGFLAKVVLQQAVILAVIGFIPGLAISYVLYSITSQRNKVPMELSPELAVSILAMTVLMCSLSGLASLRKVALADPADLF